MGLNIPEQYKDTVIIVLGCTNIVSIIAVIFIFCYTCKSKSWSPIREKPVEPTHKPFDPTEIGFDNVVAQAKIMDKSFEERNFTWPWNNANGVDERERFYSVSQHRGETGDGNFCGKSEFSASLQPPSTINTCLSATSCSSSKPDSISSTREETNESVFDESFRGSNNVPLQYQSSLMTCSHDDSDDVTNTNNIPFSSLPKRNTFRTPIKLKKSPAVHGSEVLLGVRRDQPRIDDREENYAQDTRNA